MNPELKENVSSIDTLQKKLFKLETNISNIYGISKDTLRELYEFKRKKWVADISALSNEQRKQFFSEVLETTKHKFSENEVETITQSLDEILQLKEEIQSITKIDISKLLSQVNDSLWVELSWLLKEVWNSPILSKLQNPQTITDNILWFGVGWVQSLQDLIYVSGEIIWGAIKSPYDLFQILRKKSTLDTQIKI